MSQTANQLLTLGIAIGKEEGKKNIWWKDME